MCSDKMSEKPKYLIFRYLITFIIFIMLTTTNINLEKEKQARIFDQEFYPQADALYNFAYSLTHNEADSNDLVQETYMKAFRFIDSYMEGTNAKAWLFRILKNAFINNYRKKSKRPAQVDFEDLVNYHREEDTALNSYVDMREDIYEKIIGDEVTIAISNLSVDYRTVLLLCDVEGFTYEEIAKIIDIPIGTVRSRLFRARNLLKKELSAYAKSLGFEDKRQ